MSVAKKRFNTALPKEPVPPVIIRVLLLKRDMVCPPSFLLLYLKSSHLASEEFLYGLSLFLTNPPESYIILLIEPATLSHVRMNAQPGGTFYL